MGATGAKSTNESTITSGHYGTQDGAFNRLGSDVELASVGSEDRIIQKSSGDDIKGIQVKSDVVIRVEDDANLDEGRIPRTATGRDPGGWSSANVRGGAR
jgi:hypothetical protein